MKIAVLIQDQYRLDDHAALNRAISMLQSGEASEVLAFTRIEDHAEFPSPPGTPFDPSLCGPLRSHFRNDAIASLEYKLKNLGISLKVFNASSTEQIRNELSLLNIERIFCSTNHMLDPFWITALDNSHIQVECFRGNHLFSDWPVPMDRFPKVFTELKKLITGSADLPEEPCFKADSNGIGQSPSPLANHPTDPRSSVPFDGSEETALKRVHHYFFATDGLKNYKKTRNQMIGSDYSSKFSIFLAIGSVSARRLWNEIDRYESEFGKNEGSEWMRFELLWREFFHWLARKHGPSFYRLEGIQNKSFTYHENHEGFQKWITGTTGVPFIDACMNELKTTGYLSNDPAQNYGNWSYLAGVGSDPRSFGNSPPRFFNIEKQAGEYDPREEYRKLWTQID